MRPWTATKVRPVIPARSATSRQSVHPQKTAPAATSHHRRAFGERSQYTVTTTGRNPNRNTYDGKNIRSLRRGARRPSTHSVTRPKHQIEHSAGRLDGGM